MNMTRSKYAYLLAEYPETISKEQLCKIIHVRKYTALYYLESQLLPCVDTGKATHRYSIRMSDVVTMLEDRDANPEKYLVPVAWQKKRGIHRVHNRSVGYSQYMQDKLRIALDTALESYPDLMTAADTAAVIGWHTKTVQRLCWKGNIKALVIKNRLFIPKITLIEYLMSDNCKPIHPEYKKHIFKCAKLPPSE